MGQATTAQLAQNTAALDSLISQLQNGLNGMDGNTQTLSSSKARVDALVGASGVPSGVVQNGKALRAKLDALATIQSDITGKVKQVIAAASSLRSGMETNPLYSFLKTPSDAWGSRMYEIMADLINQTTALIAQAQNLKANVSAQNSDVKGLLSDIKGTEDAAAGVGILPSISGAISSTLGTTAKSLSSIVWPIAIVAAVAGVVYVTAPSLLRGRK
jgi:hypothetical protein